MPDIKQSLRDFVATSNSGKYSNEDELLSKFPELKGYDKQSLRDYVETSNSGKYGTEEEINSKFPEIFGEVKKKNISQPVSDGGVVPTPFTSVLPSVKQPSKDTYSPLYKEFPAQAEEDLNQAKPTDFDPLNNEESAIKLKAAADVVTSIPTRTGKIEDVNPSDPIVKKNLDIALNSHNPYDKKDKRHYEYAKDALKFETETKAVTPLIKTVGTYLTELQVAPEQLNLPKDFNPDKILTNNDIERYNTILGIKQEIYDKKTNDAIEKGKYTGIASPLNYLRSYSTAVNQGTESIFRHLDGAEKLIMRDIIGLPDYGGGFKNFADYIKETKVDPYLDVNPNVVQRGLSGLGNLNAFFIEMAVPIGQAIKVGQTTLQVPKIASVMMGQEFAQKYSEMSAENKSIGEKFGASTKEGAKGLLTGYVFHGMGMGAGEISGKINNKIVSGLTNIALNSLGFSAYTFAELKAQGKPEGMTDEQWDEMVKQSTIDSGVLGAALDYKGITESILLGGSYLRAISTSNASVKEAMRMKINPEKQKKLIEKIVDIEDQLKTLQDNPENANKIQQLNIQKEVAQSVFLVDLGTKAILLDPELAKKTVTDSDKTEFDKRQEIEKINSIVAENDPLIVKSNEIQLDIDAQDAKIQSATENKSLPEAVRENIIKLAEGEKKKLQTKMQEVLSQDPKRAIIEAEDIKTLAEFEGRDVEYNGEEGTLKKVKDGIVFVDAEGKESFIESAESGKSPEDLGVKVFPEISKEEIASAKKDAEHTGEIEYNGKKYFVSAANPEKSNTIGDKVYRINKNGKITSEAFTNVGADKNKKLAVINALIEEKGLPKRTELTTPKEIQEPEYKIDGEIVSKEDVIKYATEVKGTENTKKIEINNDNETQKLIQETLTKKGILNDNQNISRVSSEVGIGEKSIQTEPNETTGGQEINRGGNIQTYGEEKISENIVGEKIKIENAPEGNHLNIGLQVGRTNEIMTSEEVLSKLPKDIKVLSFSEITGTEPSISVETSRPLTNEEMTQFLKDTKQQAIPQLSKGEGVMFDSKKGTPDGYGEFKPEWFYMQDGKSLTEKNKTIKVTKQVEKDLDSNDNGEVFLYHYGKSKNVTKEGFDPNKVSTTGTGNEKRTQGGATFFYESKSKEPSVSGDLYVVKAKSSEIYPLSKDPLNLRPEIEKEIDNYNAGDKKFGDRTYNEESIAEFAPIVLKKLGYKGFYFDWTTKMESGTEKTKRIEMFEKTFPDAEATKIAEKYYTANPTKSDIKEGTLRDAGNIVSKYINKQVFRDIFEKNGFDPSNFYNLKEGEIFSDKGIENTVKKFDIKDKKEFDNLKEEYNNSVKEPIALKEMSETPTEITQNIQQNEKTKTKVKGKGLLNPEQKAKETEAVIPVSVEKTKKTKINEKTKVNTRTKAEVKDTESVVKSLENKAKRRRGASDKSLEETLARTDNEIAKITVTGEGVPEKNIIPEKEFTKKEQLQQSINDRIAKLSNVKFAAGEEKKVNKINEICKLVKEVMELGGIELSEAIKRVIGMVPNAEKFIKENEAEISEMISPEKTSGIKKSLVSEKTFEKIDLEKISDKELIEAGGEIRASGEVDARNVVERIVEGEERALQPKEVVALLHYKVEIDTKLDNLYEQIAKNKAEGKDSQREEIDAKLLENQLFDYESMSLITAQQQSLAFRLRRYLLNREYNLQSQIAKYKAKNLEGKIEPEVEAKFRENDAKLKEINKKLKIEEAKVQELVKKELERNIIENIGKETKSGIEIRAKILADNIRKGKLIRPEMFNMANPATFVWDTAIETVAFTIEKGGKLAKAISEGVNVIKKSDWYKELKEGDKKKAEDIFIKEMSKKHEQQKDSYFDKDGKLEIGKSDLKSLIDKGLKTIEEWTSEIHKEVVKENPSITESEVMDAISGYGKESGKTRDDIQKQIDQEKIIGKLLSSLDDVLNKQQLLNIKQVAKRVLSNKEQLLRSRLNIAVSNLKQAGKPILTEGEILQIKESKRLESAKARVSKSIEDLKNRISVGDYSKKIKTPPVSPDAELLKLQGEKELIQEEFNKTQYANDLKNRKAGEKWRDRAMEAFGLTRIIAGIDLSAVAIQGLIRTATRPKQAIKAFPEMFKQMVSESRNEKFVSEFKTTDTYRIVKASGGYLSFDHYKFKAREEQFNSGWVNHIWNAVGRGTVGILKNKNQMSEKAYDIWVKSNPYKAGQRAFEGYLNMMRIQAYEEYIRILQKNGYTLENNPKAYKAMASWVNNSTGRGQLTGSLERAADILTIGIFSPRKVAANFNVMNPRFYIKMYNRSPIMAKEAMKNMLQFVGVIGTTIGLAYAAGGEDTVEFDPRSSNFLKIKIGGKYVDILAGHSQIIVFLAKMFGKLKTKSGEIKTLGGTYAAATIKDVAYQFVESKASPSAGIILRYAGSKIDKEGVRTDPFGNELTLKNELVRNTIPIWTQSVKELYEEGDPSVNSALLFLSIFGSNVQVPTKPKSKTTEIKTIGGQRNIGGTRNIGGSRNIGGKRNISTQ